MDALLARRAALAVVASFLTSAVFAFVEDLDDTFKDKRVNDIWLVDFYAPWCGYCKKLEPIWNEVGLELKISGSPVRVGKMDATAYSGMSSEFGVRGYPTIKLLKGDLAYNYKGPRTKDDIIEFANRVAGPAVRSLPSKEMFEHMLKRHNVLFVYVGGESPLKEKYNDVASELIVYTHFFSALEQVFPESLTLPELPAVVVFKDGGYFTYDEYEDASLSSWVNRERFQGYLQIDGFTLYELGETGKLVAIAVIDEKDPTEESDRLKTLMQRVAKEHREHFSRDFQFGHMDGNDYINSLIMGEVAVPSVIILNTSNEQYFLPSEAVGTMEQLVHFIKSVLNGSAQAYGGDGFIQRIKRIAFDAKSTITSVFRSSPLLGCFLFGLPLGVISLMCYGICTAESDYGSDDTDALKRLTDEEDEDEEEEQEREQSAELEGPEEDELEGEEGAEKDPAEKKTD
ncbi:protein disulfide-isomerase TMX3-like isoform X2 [Takifugu flavidus]|uniref:protein disulfide-isomerase TMX3-like isoform X2 n=1 Tax=Takifugu flavidus TaxID=433684 RepID=UPI0005D1CB85|nr:protein disulfide-isomerase TMX3-like isoform X2 [Takifugu flavidus]|eukprot:XP_011606378.1 PREDICTED: protein disulfide-isomerase TMX3 isoform X1 [Takifugu rubripes]